MNFVSTLPWWGWLSLLAVPVGIILLYFLKLRRQPLIVPSTFLWERTIEDLHVNSLLQRLRNNLLLFLQLLFVALAAIALLRPGWQGESGPSRRLIFLLDASASMSATDVSDAKSRFELAKLKIGEQIDAMRRSDTAMLIAFSDRSDILQEFTNDRRRLKDALEAATVTNRPTNMLEALRAASGLANPNRTSQAGDVNDVQVADAMPADLYIYSDGRVGSVTDFSLGNLTPTYVAIGTNEVQNLAILAFNAERNIERPEQVQAFASIANLGTETMQATASLYLEGELLEAERVNLEPEEETGLSFQLDAVEGNELKLIIEADDDLAIDNSAFAALTPIRNVSVLLISPGNRALELALDTEQAQKLGTVEVRLPDYLETEDYEKRAIEGRDDLIIYDRCTPKEMPPVNTMLVGAIPPGDAWKGGELTQPVIPIDIDRTHPIMRYLELFSLQIVEGRSLEGPRGSATLITADIGPVLVLAPRGGFQDLVMGFEILSETEQGTAFNTDWPVQRSWPVFAYNIMRYLGGAIDTSSAVTVRPGETVALRVDNRLRSVRLRSPDEKSRELSVGPAGSIPFAATDQTGFYQVFSEADSPINLFTVNLFDSRESNLTVAPEIELGYEAIESSVAVVPERSELWRWLLLIALIILATEWIIFNRRLI